MSPEERAAIEALKQYKHTGGETLAEGLVNMLMKLPLDKLQEVYARAGIKPEGSAMALDPLAGLKAEEKPMREAQQKTAAQLTPTITPQSPAATPETKPTGPQPAPVAPSATVPIQPVSSSTGQNQPSSLPVQPRPTVKAAATTAATVAVAAGAVAAKAAVPALAPVITVATPVAQQMAISGAQAVVGAAAATRDRVAAAQGAPNNPRMAAMAAQGRARTDSREFYTNIVQPQSKANKLPDAPTPVSSPDAAKPTANPSTTKTPEAKPSPPVAPTPTYTPLSTVPKPNK